ncbi:MAG: glycoside hydrolase family 68 protein [Sphingomonadaceae bacterium]
MTTIAWTRAHLSAIGLRPLPELPLFAPADCPVIVDDHWLWDFWPAETTDGDRATIGRGELWFALSAPITADGDARHGVARIRMLHRTGSRWRDRGHVFPDGFTPGSREWSGSAIVDHGRLTLYFTAAGRRGESVASTEQRLFSSETAIDMTTGHVGTWSQPLECFVNDGRIYEHTAGASGGVGTMRAFRDPAWFRDSADGTEYLLFTGSIARSESRWSGCIGIARRKGAGWQALPPLVTADGVNNELERPHVRVRDGAYWLFWSTQASVFAPDMPLAPTGLYATVGETLLGARALFSGSGLVACNPAAAPAQAYSWWVGADGLAASFADRNGLDATLVGQRAPDVRLSLT